MLDSPRWPRPRDARLMIKARSIGWRLLVAALLGMGALWRAAPALAHPHVWIDVRLTVAYDPDGRVTSLGMQWRLDELYSQASIAGLDGNGDGLYAPSELHPLIDEAMQALEEWFYFLDVQANGQRLRTKPARDYRAFLDKGHLVYAFTLPLDAPVRPDPDGLRLRVFDPSLYIGLKLTDETPVVFAEAPAACTSRIIPAPGFAETLLLNETTFSQEVQPGTDGLGGRFAETVILTCD